MLHALVPPPPPPHLFPVLSPSSASRHASVGTASMEQDEQYAGHEEVPYPQHGSLPTAHWLPDAGQGYYPGPHASPTNDFGPAYTFAPTPASSIAPHHPYAQHSYDHRQGMQPLAMAGGQWPSMLTSGQHPIYPATSAQHQPQTFITAPRLSSNSNPNQPQPPPRRTLTDADRRRMCLYHEEHPTKKQTEIGELFGVERSTVSKVLRQKEKYLASDPATLDGSRSPIKRHKPKLPDLDRTLAKWAQNQQQRGLPLTDDLIRNQARTFRAAAGGGSSKDQSEIESDSWLEKFKQKNNIGTRGPASGSKKSSPAIAEATLADATLQSPPTSIPMAATASQESTHGFHAPHRTPHHSQSNTSLSSAFNNDTGTANTNTNSPLFSPEVAAHNSTTSYFGGPENRRRSHTVSGQTDTYLSPPHTTPSSIASPGSMHHAMQPPGTLLPPSHYSYPQVGPPPGPFSSPTIADARIGLGNALTFLSRSGPESGVVGGEDFSTLQRVYERLMAARGPGEGDDRGDRLASITEHQQMV